jgi:hypothetical protein
VRKSEKMIKLENYKVRKSEKMIWWEKVRKL